VNPSTKWQAAVLTQELRKKSNKTRRAQDFFYGDSYKAAHLQISVTKDASQGALNSKRKRTLHSIWRKKTAHKSKQKRTQTPFTYRKTSS